MINESILVWIIRSAGIGLVALSLVHAPIAKRLDWNRDVKKLSPENEAVFHSHLFFICLGITLLGLALAIAPAAFVERSELGKVISVMLVVFWLVRLFRQWFAFPWALWRGKRFETLAHYVLTVVWSALVTVFALLAWWQFLG